MAQRFAASPAVVCRLMQRHRRTGSPAPSAARRGPMPRLAADPDRLRARNAADADLTPVEVRDRLGLAVAP